VAIVAVATYDDVGSITVQQPAVKKEARQASLLTVSGSGIHNKTVVLVAAAAAAVRRRHVDRKNLVPPDSLSLLSRHNAHMIHKQNQKHTTDWTRFDRYKRYDIEQQHPQ